MDDIAKLFILDEKGEQVGRLVLDMERVVDMYYTQMSHKYAEQPADDPSRIIREEDPSALTSEDDPEVRRVSDCVAWYRKLSDGTLYIRVEDPKEE